VVQVRPADDGLVLQQLLYAAEVRKMSELGVEKATVTPAELQLALQLIEQISQESYDPSQFKDEERERILKAIDKKITGKDVVASAREGEQTTGGAQVIDLMDALRASIGKKGGPSKAAAAGTEEGTEAGTKAGADSQPRKPARRSRAEEPASPPAAKPAARARR
jgi:DNA end-binding protein Ku